MSKLPTMPKDAKKTVREVLREGWILLPGGKHSKLRSPSGRIVALPGTSGDVNCAKNVIKQINALRGKVA